MTERDNDARRRTLLQVLRVVGVVALLGIVVWRIPLGSDDAPPTPTTSAAQAPSDTRPTPDAPRFSPGELDDEIPMPEGFAASAAAWDGTLFWAMESSGDSARVVSFDPETGEVDTDVEHALPADVIVADPDGVWLTMTGGSEVTLLDLVTGEAITTASLPEGADVVEIIALPGSAWVRSSDGKVIRVTTNGDVDVAAELAQDASGRFVNAEGELWVLPVEGGSTATRIDPVGLEFGDVSLSGVGHDVTVGGFADGEYFVAGPFELGSVVSQVNLGSMEVVDSQQLGGSVAYLGWVAGSFGVLDEVGRLVRLRPIAIDGERLRTSWEGDTPLFPVEREVWTITENGDSLQRILITGIAD